MRARNWFQQTGLFLPIVIYLMVSPLQTNIILGPEYIIVDSLANNEFELTWTSKWQPSRLAVMDDADLVGDHVVLNATFSESLNVTHCTMTVENGFRLNTSRELVVPSDPDSQFSGVINPTEFDWVIVKGIERGWMVNIIGNFTNGDTDFMAWSGEQEYSQLTYANNLVSMASSAKPETDEFRWESDNDTMYVGCLDYDLSPGNWTLYLQVGVYKQISVEGNIVIYDTYTLDRRNQTVDVRIEGKTESNYTLIYDYTDVTLGNFFSPDVTVPEPTEVENEVYNITWTCTDKNANDTNFFSVWLSLDGGATFQILARNLTDTFYVWNAAGFLLGDCMVRIRAFSVDLKTRLGSVDSEANYWPGDFSDGLSPSFHHVNPHHNVPVYNVNVDAPADIVYTYGNEGHAITWTLDVQILFHGFLLATTPENFYYKILRNSEVIFSASWDGTDHIVVSVDDLDAGIYNYTLSIWNPWDNKIKSDTVFVTVRERYQIPSMIILGGSIGIGVGFMILLILTRVRYHVKKT
ncbi:MAG: hypothetical protein EAX87_00320 [Candidatus Thorarchaeota archaeon]|nr:hypothetical protein [Candidatus Thorarchaeota archaeon]